MSLATCVAFSTESTNGFLISRNGVLNWASMDWPNISAVSPVPSEIINTSRGVCI